MKDVAILGVGRTPWGRFPERSFVDLGVEACIAAFKDAGVEWKDIQAMVASEWLFDGKAGLYAGECIAKALGNRGIPIVNINNACAVGASVLRAGRDMISLGLCDIVLCAGSDKAPEGFFPAMAGEAAATEKLRWIAIGATNPVHWALQCRRRMEEYGTTEVHLAKVKVKNSKYSVANPYARYHKAFTLEEVLNSPIVAEPLRLYEICAVSDGAAAVVLSSMEVARKHTANPIVLAASTIASPHYGDPTISIATDIGYKASSSVALLSDSCQASKMAYEEAGISSSDLDYIELPDNSCWHELAYMEVIGLCQPGEAEHLLDEGETELGGRFPINMSGGFSSFGEAVAAQGLMQVCEIVSQLRGQAGPRQVEGAKVALGQVYGGFGNSGTFILKR